MLEAAGEVLKRIGLYRPVRVLYDLVRGTYLKQFFLKHFLPYQERKVFISTYDPVRYGSIFLAIKMIKKESIKGSFAEAGVYKGYTSSFLHSLMPERTLYLFDTFEGFPALDLEAKSDQRFNDTAIDIVKAKIGDVRNVVFRKGYFPATARGLENETFAFVMLDLDLYHPTRAGLEFFYPRVSSAGYIFIHDYNSSESNYGVQRAVNEFMSDKTERLIEIPDIGGSVVIRKI